MHKLFIQFFIFMSINCLTHAAIVPPPWSDPDKNPCALMPGGWQLIYWPPLKKCFKIFSKGFPCPETMELAAKQVTFSRGKSSNHNAPIAECRCPPGTAMSVLTNSCHQLFERGPCELGQYFSPLPPKERHAYMQQTNRSTLHWGICKDQIKCEEGKLFWPPDGKCYAEYTKGPCFRGKLITLNKDNLAECKCEKVGKLKEFFYEKDETCHEHYTKGPCTTPGLIFMPNGQCGCDTQLPNYYEPKKMCFELDSPGPCASGHIFTVRQHKTNKSNAECACKPDYVPWSNGQCYRLYTRGPCAHNEFLINATSCAKNCNKSRLYFPKENSCFRIGTQGPCSLYQVVVFDFNARPSIDGTPLNGVCGCSAILKELDLKCEPTTEEIKSIQNMYATAKPSKGTTLQPTTRQTCEALPGNVLYKGDCYELYTQGPCASGQWLEAKHPSDAQELDKAKCTCRPGFTPARQLINDDNNNALEAGGIVQPCNAPVVGLAKYLNTQTNAITNLAWFHDHRER